jgi:hypothetical protein
MYNNANVTAVAVGQGKRLSSGVRTFTGTCTGRYLALSSSQSQLFLLYYKAVINTCIVKKEKEAGT